MSPISSPRLLRVGRAFLAMYSALAATTGCGREGTGTLSPVDSAEVARATGAVLDAYEAGEVAADPDAQAALFTQDAYSGTQGYPTSQGREAILAGMRSSLGTERAISLDFKPLAVSQLGPAAAMSAGTAAAVTDVGGRRTTIWWRYVAIFRYEPDGVWRFRLLSGFQDSTRTAN